MLELSANTFSYSVLALQCSHCMLIVLTWQGQPAAICTEGCQQTSHQSLHSNKGQIHMARSLCSHMYSELATDKASCFALQSDSDSLGKVALQPCLLKASNRQVIKVCTAISVCNAIRKDSLGKVSLQPCVLRAANRQVDCDSNHESHTHMARSLCSHVH